jgi:hypothetical protein
MRKVLTVLLLFTLFSCGDDTVTISKSEYNQLRGIKQKTKRTLTFPEGSNANGGFDLAWEIIEASDGHDYLENNSYHGYIIMHYVECNKCNGIDLSNKSPRQTN